MPSTDVRKNKTYDATILQRALMQHASQAAQVKCELSLGVADHVVGQDI